MNEAERSETNRRVVRAAFEGWQQGTAPVADLFSDDMTWRIEGRSRASKEYHSKQQLMTELLIPFGQRFKATEPFRPVTIRSLHADGDTVVVVWDGRGAATDGEPYENRAAWFLTMDGGKVVDGTVFWDCDAYDNLCTRTSAAL